MISGWIVAQLALVAPAPAQDVVPAPAQDVVPAPVQEVPAPAQDATSQDASSETPPPTPGDAAGSTPEPVSDAEEPTTAPPEDATRPPAPADFPVAPQPPALEPSEADAEIDEILDERFEDEEELGGPVKRGITISLGAGYAGCSKAWCAGYRGGLGGMVEAGFRFNRIMPFVGWHGGVGPYDTAQLSDEVGASVTGSPRVKTNTVGAGLRLFPLGKEVRRIDPHIGVRFGYGWVRMDYSAEDFAVRERLRRGVVTLGGGVDGFVTENLALGVRLDMHIMFGGEYCITVSDGARSAGSCAQSDDDESRADPRDWPLPFSALFQLRYTWGLG